MPPIYRHIVPNAAAYTVRNGAPAYRGDAPSYQREINFAVQWVGDIDFDPYKAWYDTEHPDRAPIVAGQKLTAAEINAHWDQAGGVLDGSPCAYGNLPVYTLIPRVDGFSCDAAALGEAESFELDAEDVKLWDVNVCVYLEWDAANTAWRWIAALTPGATFNRFLLSDEGGDTTYARFGHYGSAVDCTAFASAYTTEKLRIGNATTLPLIRTLPEYGGWAAEGFAHCYLVLSAAWA